MINILKLVYVRIMWIVRNFKNIRFDSEIFSVSAGDLHGKVTYRADGIITSTNCDFIKNPRFSNAYQKASETNPWPNFTLQWRVYIVCWLADHIKNLEGDFVECGVNTGAYSRAIIDYIDFPSLNKAFYLLDTFEGLVKEQITKEEKEWGIDKYLGNYKNVYEQVQKTFEGFNVKIIKGAVPATLPECDAQKICYLSIDMNCAEPEIEALKYFWNRIVSGGVIILDDYGFPQHIIQKRAFDELGKKMNFEILALPTGQGIIFKK